MSRANPVWRALAAGVPSVVMFQGPDAYITPGWYPGKTAHGKVVPTWNYVVAHAHGVACAIDDRDWLLDMLGRLSHAHEPARSQLWRDPANGGAGRARHSPGACNAAQPSR